MPNTNRHPGTGPTGGDRPPGSGHPHRLPPPGRAEGSGHLRPLRPLPPPGGPGGGPGPGRALCGRRHRLRGGQGPTHRSPDRHLRRRPKALPELDRRSRRPGRRPVRRGRAGEGPGRRCPGAGPRRPGIGRMTGAPGEPGYAFGDSDAAAERLGMLAELFDAPSRSLLRSLGGARIGLAIDLGCGPGHTTRLLADLPQPDQAVADWIGQLRPAGLLVLEEDEDIVTNMATFVRYEAMSSDLVRARGGDLYIGRRLADRGWDYAEVVLSRSFHHRLAVPTVARLFAMNCRVWRHDPHVTQRHAEAELDQLADELQALAQSSIVDQVDFVIRQVIVQAR